MRMDKFLKNSRLIKRRTVAKEACETGRVLLNEKVAKPSDEVKIGDIITISFGKGDISVRVLDTKEIVGKADAESLYEKL